ncbi:MAG: UMP kinase [Candidatus Diapherotrites archaeon]
MVGVDGVSSIFDMFSEAYEEQKTDDEMERGHEPEEEYSSSTDYSYSPKPAITYVISVGGSILIDQKPDYLMIAKFAESINKLSDEGYRIVLVVGGGKVCRNYVAAAKSLGANNFQLDELGITITRANASLLLPVINNAHKAVLTEVNQARPVLDVGKIPVFGGLHPGITTDAVAALLAEALDGIFINLTNVDGVYSMDPKKHPHAKFYDEIAYNELISLMKLGESKPAQNLVLDLPCCLILKRSKLKGMVMNGTDLDNFEAAIRGGEFKGTVIGDKNE